MHTSSLTAGVSGSWDSERLLFLRRNQPIFSGILPVSMYCFIFLNKTVSRHLFNWMVMPFLLAEVPSEATTHMWETLHIITVMMQLNRSSKSQKEKSDELHNVNAQCLAYNRCSIMVLSDEKVNG